MERFEIEQNGVVVASGTVPGNCQSLDDVARIAMHYAQFGPVTMRAPIVGVGSVVNARIDLNRIFDHAALPPHRG